MFLIRNQITTATEQAERKIFVDVIACIPNNMVDVTLGHQGENQCDMLNILKLAFLKRMCDTWPQLFKGRITLSAG